MAQLNRQGPHRQRPQAPAGPDTMERRQCILRDVDGNQRGVHGACCTTVPSQLIKGCHVENPSAC